MKGLLRASCLAALVAMCVAAAGAQTIVDDFSTNGNLTGSTPDSGVGVWTTINSGTPALSVSSGTLTIAASSGEASQLNFSSSDLNSGTIYMGFTFSVDSNSSIGTNNSIQAVAGFRLGTASSGSYALSFGVFRPSSAAQSTSSLSNTSTSQVVAGLFNTGTSQNASTIALTGWATPLTLGTNYRVVIGMDLANDTATLWIAPTSSSSTSITLSGVTSDARGVFFRQGGSSTGTDYVSNLKVSTDFDTAALTSVPEPSTYAALLGAATLAGVVIWRRRMAGLAS